MTLITLNVPPAEFNAAFYSANRPSRSGPESIGQISIRATAVLAATIGISSAVSGRTTLVRSGRAEDNECNDGV